MRSHQMSWLLVLAVGCGGGGGGPGASVIDDYDESPGSAEDLSQWAGSASAPAIYGQAQSPVLVADLALQLGGGDCPAKVETDTTTTYDGGCTDDNGTEWFGHAEVVQGTTPGSAGRVGYDGFGFTGDVDACPGQRNTSTWDGSMIQTTNSTATSVSFSVDIRVTVSGVDEDNGCAALEETLGIDYEGSMVTDAGGGGAGTFSGSGQIGTSVHGKVSVSTDDELVDDDVCQDEALSGTTTISASGHSAVITYDGATDCDPESTVTWTYDGVDQGELTGISCGVAGGTSGPASLLLVAGALVLARRRRAR